MGCSRNVFHPAEEIDSEPQEPPSPAGGDQQPGNAGDADTIYEGDESATAAIAVETVNDRTGAADRVARTQSTGGGFKRCSLAGISPAAILQQHQQQQQLINVIDEQPHEGVESRLSRP